MDFNVRRHALNVIASNAAFIAQIACLVALTPFYIEQLGVERYGVFVIFNTVVAYSMLVNLGVPQAFLRQLIRANADGSVDVSRLISSTHLLYSAVFSAALVFVLLILFFFDAEILSDIDAVLVMVSSALVMVLLFSELIQQVLISKDKIYLVRCIRVAEVLGAALASLVFLPRFPSIATILVVQLFFAVVAYLVYFYKSKQHIKFELSLRYAELKSVRDMAPASAWYFLGSASVILIFQADVMLIAHFFIKEQVAVYFTMFRFCDSARILISTVPAALFPRISHLTSIGSLRSNLSLYLKVSALTVGLVAFGACLFVLIGFDLYKLWITNVEFHDETLFLGVAAVSLLISLDSPSSTFAGAMGEHKWPIIVGFIQGLLKVLIAFLLIERLGLIGAPLAGGLAFLLTNFWFNPWFVFRKLALNSKKTI